MKEIIIWVVVISIFLFGFQISYSNKEGFYMSWGLSKFIDYLKESNKEETK